MGGRGRMGTVACAAIEAAPDLELAAVVGSQDDREVLRGCDVVVDLTRPDVVRGNVDWCVDAGICMVVGTTGWDEPALAALRTRLVSAPALGVVVAANFSIAAALMIRFAAQAATYLSDVQIVELHHPQKEDAPSGTAVATAREVAERRGAGTSLPTGGAGGDALGAVVSGVPVHSVRLSGLVAHQRVLLGAVGETLTIQHDSYDRSSFMPGLLMAVRTVRSRPGLTVGMEALLNP